MPAPTPRHEGHQVIIEPNQIALLSETNAQQPAWIFFQHQFVSRVREVRLAASDREATVATVAVSHEPPCGSRQPACVDGGRYDPRRYRSLPWNVSKMMRPHLLAVCGWGTLYSLALLLIPGTYLLGLWRGPLESATVAAVARRCRRSPASAPGAGTRWTTQRFEQFQVRLSHGLLSGRVGCHSDVALAASATLETRLRLARRYDYRVDACSRRPPVPEPIQLANRTPAGRGLSLGRLVFRVVLWSVRDFVDLADIVVDLARRPPRRRRDSPPPVLHHSQCRLMPWR